MYRQIEESELIEKLTELLDPVWKPATNYCGVQLIERPSLHQVVIRSPGASRGILHLDDRRVVINTMVFVDYRNGFVEEFEDYVKTLKGSTIGIITLRY